MDQPLIFDSPGETHPASNSEVRIVRCDASSSTAGPDWRPTGLRLDQSEPALALGRKMPEVFRGCARFFKIAMQKFAMQTFAVQKFALQKFATQKFAYAVASAAFVRPEAGSQKSSGSVCRMVGLPERPLETLAAAPPAPAPAQRAQLPLVSCRAPITGLRPCSLMDKVSVS